MAYTNSGKNRRAISEQSGARKVPIPGAERTYTMDPDYSLIYGNAGATRAKAASAAAPAPSVGEARVSSPDILEKAKIRADREGRSFLAVLREQLASEQPAAEPTEVCLTPDETLSFFEERQISSTRLAHVEECRWCRRMLSEAMFAGDGFWEILRRMQAEAKVREEAALGS